MISAYSLDDAYELLSVLENTITLVLQIEIKKWKQNQVCV